MTTGNLSFAAIGRMAIASGIISILAIALLILFFTVGQPFGTLNDIFNGIAGIAILILAWMLYAEHHAKSPLLSQIALMIAIVGAIVVVIGSILVIFQITGWVLAGSYTGAGNALIGLWLAAFCYSMQRSDTLPHNLIVFGLVVGACMAFGLILIPGILARIDNMESPPWYLYIGYVGFLGTSILYPIWAIWLGRVLMSR
ncbi:MAG: hypothetical protein HND47_05365 [Chloroflexi bacterium]|nr:hypothetical protein [Chloroflexota bacterium]